MFKGECDLIEAKRGEASRGEARQRKEKRERKSVSGLVGPDGEYF